MTVLTFSFQALEAFCNETISYRVTGIYVLKRDKGIRNVTGDELERLASTEEKLGTILPDLLNVPTPKGTRIWDDFVELKRARDATAHIKSRDSSPRVTQPIDLDSRPLFHRFLGADVFAWVAAAVVLIDYFTLPGDTRPWLEHAKSTLGVQAKRPTANQTKKMRPPLGKRL